MKKRLWFKPGTMKRHSGFKKEYSIRKNLEIMYLNSKLKDPKERWLRVGRQANVLANLSQDKETVKIAREVATQAFKKVAKLNIK